MKVAVVGLWHLGTVTAACLASRGHDVVGLDFQPELIESLNSGVPPLFETGLEDLLRSGLAAQRLTFTTDIDAALVDRELVWITFDTPVNDQDEADVDFVVQRIRSLFPALREGSLVLVSSQLPVGTIHTLEQHYRQACPGKPVTFSCSPENLRLGKSIDVFTHPDRVVVGVRTMEDRPRITELMAPFTDRIEWMGIESAEMTKHAINAFLATSVVFINELALLCERVGADAKEVERGLKSESRIGPKAYLSPGGPFAGGTLARDIYFLIHRGSLEGLSTPLFEGVKKSNDYHQGWVRHTLERLLGGLRQQTVAVLGLTYKPGTDTLRRSAAVELCRWLAEQGARVHAHDPAVKILPEDLAAIVSWCEHPIEAASGADALVIATEWPEYRNVPAEEVVRVMARPIVVDSNRFVQSTLGSHPGIRYCAVGKGIE